MEQMRPVGKRWKRQMENGLGTKSCLPRPFFQRISCGIEPLATYREATLCVNLAVERLLEGLAPQVVRRRPGAAGRVGQVHEGDIEMPAPDAEDAPQ